MAPLLLISADAKSTVFLIASLCVLALVFWSLRERASSMPAQPGIRVLSFGKTAAFFGCVLFVFGFYPDSGNNPWNIVIAGLVVGGVVGEIVGKKAIGKWNSELQLEGELKPQTRRWWQSWRGQVPLVLAVLSIGILLPANFPASPSGLNSAFIAMGNGLCGFFIVSVLHTALWAQRKEREIRRPLVIPIHRI